MSIDARTKKVAKFHQEVNREKILEAESRLAELGYWTGAIDGEVDKAFRHAVLAFQKLADRKRTGHLSNEDLQTLRIASRPIPRETGYAHVEIDITHQVLFFVAPNGTVSRILPVCTGSERLYTDQGKVQRAHTPRGKFKVLRQIHGWRLSSLGLLYYPNYIHNGIAVHGSLMMRPVPDSHGCIRIPMFAAKEVSTLMPVGTDVILYD